MKTHDLRKKLHEHLKSPTLALFALAAVLVSGAAATNWAGALYILTGVEDSAIVLDGSQSIPDLSDRMMYVASGSKGYDIRLDAKLDVTIFRDGETLTTVSKKETISALLTRMGITLSPLEMVAVDLSDQELVLTVAEDITYYDKVCEVEPFNTVRVANPELPEGTERVVQEGADGIRTSIYEVVWSNGTRISRQFVEELDNTAVDQIVEYGTAEEVFYNPQHPYTWALLSSMPDLDTNEKLDAIPGTPPNMIYPPVGDAFAERNKYALEIDYEMQPPMFEVSPTHYAATWLLHPNAPKVEVPKIITERIKRMKERGGNYGEQ